MCWVSGAGGSQWTSKIVDQMYAQKCEGEGYDGVGRKAPSCETIIQQSFSTPGHSTVCRKPVCTAWSDVHLTLLSHFPSSVRPLHSTQQYAPQDSAPSWLSARSGGEHMLSPSSCTSWGLVSKTCQIYTKRGKAQIYQDLCCGSSQRGFVTGLWMLCSRTVSLDLYRDDIPQSWTLLSVLQ